jgi:hypothetical protein
MNERTNNRGKDPRHDAFDREVDLFLETSPLTASRDYVGTVCRKVRERKRRQDRVFRGGAWAAVAIALGAAAWFGIDATDRETVAEAEDPELTYYAEIYLMEELLYGAEALGDEEALETLDYLLGG